MENMVSWQKAVSEVRAFHCPADEYMSVMQTDWLRVQEVLVFFFFWVSMVSFLFLESVAIESIVCNGLIRAVVHRRQYFR